MLASGIGALAKLKLPSAIIDCEPFAWPGTWPILASRKSAASLLPADWLKYVAACASTWSSVAWSVNGASGPTTWKLPDEKSGVEPVS